MITNLNEFIDYIKLKLGFPVLSVEIDDSQFVQIIEDSVQTYWRYSMGDGAYQTVLSINLSANVSAYQLPVGIDSVIDMDLSTSRGSLNDLFTVQRQMIVQQFQYGSMLGGNGYGTMGPRTLGGQNNLSEYNINMLAIKQVQDFFQKRYTCQFSSNTNTLRVWPTPEEDCVAMLTVWTRELAQDLYNGYHVKNLAVAQAMIQLGIHLGKYNIQLPGSSTINYQMYIDRGTALEEKTLENIKLETWLPTIGVG
jgi:hypothetical protein